MNPISGTRSKKVLRNKIENITRSAIIDFTFEGTTQDGNYDHLVDYIKTEKFTKIGICGGDGSVNQVVNALAHLNIPFGIIPMGSGNGLALTANIPKNPEKALEILFTGKPALTDGFMINNRFACMLAGLGFDAGVAHEFAEQESRGLKTYARLTTRHFFSAPFYPFTISANGLSFDTEAFFISVANSNQFGNSFTIAPEALLNDGLLDIVIVKKTAKPLLLLNVVKQVLLGKVKTAENSLQQSIIYFQTDKLTIENHNNAPLHIDGEPSETESRFEIKILPNFFKLIRPRIINN